MRRLLAIAAGGLALAGCGGGSAPPPAAPTLPRALGHAWAQRAEAIAAAAAAGDGCRAERLATSLRDDVISAEGRVPGPLRSSLLTTVNRLADSIACTPPAQTVTTVTTVPAPPGQVSKKPKPPAPPGRGRARGGGGDDRGHGRGHGKGDG